MSYPIPVLVLEDARMSSPDGRRLAYVSNESGHAEIYHSSDTSRARC